MPDVAQNQSRVYRLLEILCIGTCVLWLLGVLLWQAKHVWLTVDEPVHIMAGAEYWHLRGLDHNPEHPILGKLIMTLPLLRYPIQFPDAQTFFSSTPRVEGQPDMARAFMEGNAQNRVLYRSRVGASLFTVLFVFVFWYGVRRFRGGFVAALATIFLVTSPTVLGHGYLVTTDVGATFGVMLVIFALTNFLRRCTWPSVLALAGSFAFAFTVKYSTLILLPYASLAAGVWAVSQYTRKDFYLGRFWIQFSIAILLAVGLILLLYAAVGLGVSDQKLYVPPDVKWGVPFTGLSAFFSRIGNGSVFLRPLSYFVSGALIAFYRSSQVMPTYFLGHIVAVYNPWYFPIVYFIKEQIWFHVLTVVAFCVGCRLMAVSCYRMACSQFMRAYILELLVVGFIFCYGFVAVNSGLNIGIRHLLPIIPLVAFGIARVVVHIFKRAGSQTFFSGVTVQLLLGMLLFFQIVFTVGSGPFYLPFSNMLFGGPCQTGAFLQDSNFVWEQNWGSSKTNALAFTNSCKITSYWYHSWSRGDSD